MLSAPLKIKNRGMCISQISPLRPSLFLPPLFLSCNHWSSCSSEPYFYATVIFYECSLGFRLIFYRFVLAGSSTGKKLYVYIIIDVITFITDWGYRMKQCCVMLQLY